MDKAFETGGCQIAGRSRGSTRAKEDTQSCGARAGFLQPFDLALTNESFKLVAFVEDDFGIGSSCRERPVDELRSESGSEVLMWIERLDHERLVPPTTMRSSLMVGMPTPTGTLWPSLPQVPMPSSRRRS